jgi:Ras-related protein Rab-8A
MATRTNTKAKTISPAKGPSSSTYNNNKKNISTTTAPRTHTRKSPVLKILVIGDTGVGKSCLLLRFADDSFTPSFMPTIGIDFKVKEIEVEGQKTRLQVWDTAGQDRFRSITTAYYRGAHGVMLVYDVTDAKSFDNVKNWMQNIDEHASKSVNRILVANKSDMQDKRVIGPERGRALAEKYGVKFFETSARTGSEVNEAFEALALEIKRRVLDPVSDDSGSCSSDEDLSSGGSGNKRFQVTDPTKGGQRQRNTGPCCSS